MHLLLNERVLLGLIAFGAWLIQKINSARRKAAAERAGRPVASGAHGEPMGGSDEDPAARARRMRTEAARKLAERGILMMPSARRAAPPPPRPQWEARSEQESSFEREDPAPPPLAPNLARVPAAAATGPSAPSYPPGLMALPPSPITMPLLVEAAEAERPGANWLEELRQTQTARRAILLTEILGPPVALR